MHYIIIIQYAMITLQFYALKFPEDKTLYSFMCQHFHYYSLYISIKLPIHDSTVKPPNSGHNRDPCILFQSYFVQSVYTSTQLASPLLGSLSSVLYQRFHCMHLRTSGLYLRGSGKGHAHMHLPPPPLCVILAPPSKCRE